MWRFFIAVFLAYLAVVHAAQEMRMGDTKIWIPDTNFDNPKNWDSGHLPCENERVVFPSDGRVVSMLTTSIAVSELVLPLDGQLVFANNAELRLTGGVSRSTCSPKDVHFVVPNLSWHDPDNWNISSWRAYPSTPGNIAIPHAYRVPCRTDHVIFPLGRSFKVQVESSPTVATMSINNVNFNNEEVSNFLVSQTGNLLFPGNPQITVSGNGCSELRGCTCGNDEPQVMSRICRHKKDCPAIQCSDPVQPVGHCCKICGSFLVMEYDEHFKIATLLDLHNTYLGKGEYRDVLSYTGRTYKDKIQAVFSDSGENKGMAAEVAQKVYNSLYQDINSAKYYKLRSVNLYSSIEWNDDVIVHGAYKAGASAGEVVGILFAVAIVIGGVVAALYIYRRRNITGFSFARFDVNVGRMELGTTPHEELQPDEPSTPEPKLEDKAFDNPVYGKSSVSGQERDDPAVSATGEEFVENPMFMLFEDKPESESSKS